MSDISIGDLHGKNCWRQLLDQDFDECFFLGDYFDPRDGDNIPAVTQIRNFKDIVKLARENSNVHLCLGNHDYHYLRGIKSRYSGFQYYNSFDIQEVLEDNIDLLKIVYIKGNNIISHAGVSKTFLEIHDIKDILDINDIFNFDRSIIEFSRICYDDTGDDPSSSPIWIRPNSLVLDKVDNYNQIVGHTRVPYINTIENITFCDCLGKVVDSFKF